MVTIRASGRLNLLTVDRFSRREGPVPVVTGPDDDAVAVT
jgi:hypothetical protein